MEKGYECHLTFSAENSKTVEELTPFGWCFSQIDGDPVLGKGPRCYWTAWSTSQGAMEQEMEKQVRFALENFLGLQRAKIEHIIYDQRY